MRTQSEWKVDISGRCVELFAQHGGGALLHLVGRLVGEGDGQDSLGADAVADQLGDAVGDDAGLAGSRPGQHQQRPGERVDGVVLGGIQVHRDRRHAVAGFPDGKRWQASRKGAGGVLGRLLQGQTWQIDAFYSNCLRIVMRSKLIGPAEKRRLALAIWGDFNHTERFGKGREVGINSLDSHPSEAWYRNEILKFFARLFVALAILGTGLLLSPTWSAIAGGTSSAAVQEPKDWPDSRRCKRNSRSWCIRSCRRWSEFRSAAVRAAA